MLQSFQVILFREMQRRMARDGQVIGFATTTGMVTWQPVLPNARIGGYRADEISDSQSILLEVLNKARKGDHLCVGEE
jgi:hypothetical protein